MEEIKTFEEITEVPNTEETIKQCEIEERAAKIAVLTSQIFEERREAFQEMTKWPSLSEIQMDAVMDSLMDKRSKLFEKLAEGAK